MSPQLPRIPAVFVWNRDVARRLLSGLPLGCLLAGLLISTLSAQPVKLPRPSTLDDVVEQLAIDSQRITVLEDQLKQGMYEKRLVALETSVGDIQSGIKETVWILRGLIGAIATELLRRMWASSKSSS